MKKLFLIIATIVLFLLPPMYAQNLIFNTDTTGSVTQNTEDSIIVDLDYDADLIQSDYGFTQQEARAIGIVLHSTWTNDSLQVYAAIDPDSTYYPVYYDGAVLTLVATTGSSYIAFNPQHFAGIRYLMLNMPANEAANRMYTIVRRRY